MNEQIKELEKQAFDAVWNLYNYPIGPGTHFRPDGFEEKFAELIVKECIAQARADENSPAYEAVARIARHFGVE